MAQDGHHIWIKHHPDIILAMDDFTSCVPEPVIFPLASLAEFSHFLSEKIARGHKALL
jgi:hypothetical protein